MLVVIAPLRFGAGVKGKVNYGLNNGVPVIATEMACEGMHLVDGESVYIANTGSSFRGGIIRLSEDKALWMKLQKGGVEVMKNFFGVNTATDILLRSQASRLPSRKQLSAVFLSL